MKRWRKLLLLIPAALILVYLLIWGPKEQQEVRPAEYQTLWFDSTTIAKVEGKGKEHWGFVEAPGRWVLAVENWELNPVNPKGPGFRKTISISLPEVTEPVTIDLATTPDVVISFHSSRDPGLSLKPGSVKGTLKITSISEKSVVVTYQIRLLLQHEKAPGWGEPISQLGPARPFARQDRPAADTIAGQTIQQNKEEWRMSAFDASLVGLLGAPLAQGPLLAAAALPPGRTTE